jgi:hypothetical protein
VNAGGKSRRAHEGDCDGRRGGCAGDRGDDVRVVSRQHDGAREDHGNDRKQNRAHGEEDELSADRAQPWEHERDDRPCSEDADDGEDDRFGHGTKR